MASQFLDVGNIGPCIEKPGYEGPAEIVRGTIRNPGLPASNLKAHHQGLRGDGRTGGDNPGLRDRTEQRPGFIPPGGNPGIERVLTPIGSVNVPFPVPLPQDPQGPGFDVIVLDPGGGGFGPAQPGPEHQGEGGGDEDPLADLKASIAKLKGQTALLETTSAGWGEGKASSPQADYVSRRIGANPPVTLSPLRTEAGMAVLSACGVPVSLMTDADGTSQRESWRRFVMGSVEPMLRTVAAEINEKLEASIRFDLGGLWAHDLAGRAQAFQKLVAGGQPINDALATAGLMASDD